MPYTKQIIKIFDNIMWTTNRPYIYLTLTYEAYVDESSGEQQNRDRQNLTYTFNNLTLTVTMPGKSSYYGYTIGCRIISGDYATSIVQLKGSSPQYWETYTYNFGDFVVRNVSNKVEFVPLFLQMYTNAPSEVSWTNKELTPEAVQILKDNGYYGVDKHSLSQWAQYSANSTGLSQEQTSFVVTVKELRMEGGGFLNGVRAVNWSR